MKRDRLGAAVRLGGRLLVVLYNSSKGLFRYWSLRGLVVNARALSTMGFWPSECLPGHHLHQALGCRRRSIRRSRPSFTAAPRSPPERAAGALDIDAAIYKLRLLIENFFGKLKELKRIPHRANKIEPSFEPMTYLAAATPNSR